MEIQEQNIFDTQNLSMKYLYYENLIGKKSLVDLWGIYINQIFCFQEILEQNGS